MFNFNNGYIGKSRSVRSQEAIDNYEVPASMIDRDLIEDFLDDSNFNDAQKEYLNKLPLYLWKAYGSTSWHHTGSYYRETDHYDLQVIADIILDNKDHIKNIINDHRKELKAKRLKAAKWSIYVYTHEIWDNSSKKHPKMIGTEHGYGVTFGESNRLYPVVCISKEGTKSTLFDKKYYNLIAKSIDAESFDTYDLLIKEYKEFKSTKRLLNKVIKLHCLNK